MSSLAESEKRSLLQVARRALTAAATGIPSTESLATNPALMQPGGAFVTLFHKGRLRGCIGQLPFETPLVEVAAHCARAVASEDPRFSPVTAEELPAIQIEISVLSELVEVKPEQIVPGTHGLLVSNGSRRGVLLPQVAGHFHWDGTRFLEATCEKAGLPKDAWKSPATRIEAFTAEVFGEAELQNE